MTKRARQPERPRIREGLVEPIDAIAVTKLETVLEVLLRPESSSGSERRMLIALNAFFGLKPADLIAPNSQTTAKQFAKGFVRDRSRVLHGTWSTLRTRLRTSRDALEHGDIRGLSDRALVWILDGAEKMGLEVDRDPGSPLFRLAPDDFAPLVNMAPTKPSLEDRIEGVVARRRRAPRTIILRKQTSRMIDAPARQHPAFLAQSFANCCRLVRTK